MKRRKYRIVQQGLLRENFSYETGILDQLRWESLKQRGKQSRLMLLNNGLKGKVSIPTVDLVHPHLLSLNMHPMAFQTVHARIGIYEFRVFPRTVRDGNELPTSPLSFAGDCIAKFTNLVRSGLGTEPFSRRSW